MVVSTPGDERNDTDPTATDSDFVTTAFGANLTDVLPQEHQPTAFGLGSTAKVLLGLAVGAVVLLGGD